MASRLALVFAVWGAFAEAGGRNELARLTPERAHEYAFSPPAGSHQYTLTAEAGAYVRVSVRPRDCDVVITLRGADGKPLADVDNDWTGGLEELEWVAGAEGTQRIDVRSKWPTVPGTYRIEVSRTRPAAPADRARVAAARALWRGKELLREEKAEATKEAERAFQEALSLSRSVGDARGEALALGGLANVSTDTGEYGAAIERAEAALGLWQRMGDVRQQAGLLGTASNAFQKLGRRDEALDLAQEALDISLAESDREGEMYALLLLALVKPPSLALPVTERALTLARSLGNRRSEGEALTTLVNVHLGSQDLEPALEALHQALAVSRETGERLFEAINLNNLGNVYNNLGEPRRARQYLEQALALCRELGNRGGEAVVLNAIGLSYHLEEDWAGAVSFLEKSLALRAAVGDRAGESRTLNSLGWIYVKRGSFQEARERFERVLSISEADKSSRAGSLVGMAAVVMEEGDLEKSRALALQALALVESFGGTGYVAIYQLAKVERARGHQAEAAALTQRALKLMDSQIWRVQSADFRASMLSLFHGLRDLQMDSLMALHAAEPGGGHDERAFQAVEGTRARGLLDLLAESRANVREGAEAGLLEQERGVRERLGKASADALRVRAQGPATQEPLEREMDALTWELQRVEAEIRKQSPRYAALTQPEPIRISEVQALLDEDTLLLEYWLGKQASYAWLVGRRSVNSVTLAPKEAIEAAARRALTAMESQQGDAEAAAAELSRLVLGPLAERLNSRRLVVVADGALQYVPFAALPHPGGGPVLVHQEVVSLPSASTLAFLRRDRPARAAVSGTVAILADPVFDARDERLAVGGRGKPAVAAARASSGGRVTRAVESGGLSGRIPRLPFTRREAKAIVAGAPASSTFSALDFEASRATMFDPRLAQYRVIHLATHGFFNASRPELSGVLLSMFDKEGRPQPGFLAAPDTFNLKLSSDLVVLSGCRTALGKEVKGEGIVGLTRGFMYAGADRVLASLWPVDDAATAALMGRFYSEMFGPGKLPPAAALRAAQLDLMKQPRYRHPFFWAAFQLQGEWK